MNPTGIKQLNDKLPASFSLSQNFPNPFNPSTTIAYELPKEVRVTLKVYDMLGREIAILVNDEQSAGSYQAQWNAEGVSSGLYIAKISAGEFSKSIKMTLMK